MSERTVSWNGTVGTAGGGAFGGSLRAYAAERGVEESALAAACGLSAAQLEDVFAGNARVGVSCMARMVQALRSRPIEFMQKSGLLSLEAYASGLDPLYFLPEGQTRYDARIYMREINPRHPVPEGDMTKRNATLKAVGEDTLLDALGKIEIELAYLLRVAVQFTGGAL
ncbi:MAG TPA: hypothetical protein VIO32_01030 [Candidatus Baltobacteraceae bacterium]